MTNRLIEEKHFTEKTRYVLKPDLAEHVFRFCTFEGMQGLEERFGASIESCFLSCTFTECEWYAPFFSCALFFHTKFERCTFHGGSFAGCWFVGCEFDECRFERDNLGSSFTFNDVRWYDCERRRTPGLAEQF
jgi:uncharacterized protein YjbI with pentapeptide repeats